MLNLVMTHSPRIAAMATNKRFGPDLVKASARQHRIDWLRGPRASRLRNQPRGAEPAFRGRTA
ncbi:MAG: hypothetical protein IPF51_14785 [Dehalococcoidia bacterium]|uniref:hypothetical protein n=1 Tax=Candidatus Amarobacter glycogenicus TaxID=3140699 RepID=UPI003135E88D|nr:hypothetical protein [Dehalococcoidia bacterium]